MKRLLLFVSCLMIGVFAHGQEGPDSGREAFGNAVGSVQQKLEASIAELNQLRERTAEETIPLSRELRELEDQLTEVRSEFQQTTRILDSRTLDLSNLRTEIQRREQEATYLSNLLGEYIRNFESRLHIAELQLYRETLEEARLAPENSALSEEEVFHVQANMLSASLDRLDESLGGDRFNGAAVDTAGIVKNGTFVLLGPAAIFSSDDGEIVGTAEQRLGSLEAAAIPFNDAENMEAARNLIAGSTGFFPLDPTLGNAHKIEETEETFIEHVRKGGPVMIPIFCLAGAALLVALFKWFCMILVRNPSQGRINRLLLAVEKHDREVLAKEEKALRKPRVHPVFDWLYGGLFGAAFGAAAWSIHRVDLGSFVSPINLGTDVTVYVIAFAAGGAALQFLLMRIVGSSPVGRMLAVGIDHVTEPPELIEEVMYEQMLSTRLSLERFLPFVAISAAAAPLLGLLGTVTGIINTFKLITVFGSGDVKTLSGGISEALVTTEFGLIVAIPSLLIHAFLSRKARGVVNQMEKAAVAFVNQVSKTPFADSDGNGRTIPPRTSPEPDVKRAAPESPDTQEIPETEPQLVGSQ